MYRTLALSLTLALSASVSAQQLPAQWNTPGAGNPIVPGYFADPTIRKFGDTYYIYATTDGTGNGYGPAQVWMTKDFVNWRNQVMNWPTTEVVWAPDVIQAPNGKYRYYYCEPCMVHAGESDSPVGPWKNMLGDPEAVLMPDRYCHPKAITLDPQVFTDDDGSQYMFVGTWGFYDDAGCGWAKLAPDGKSFTDKGLISSRQLKDFFEGPFLFKRNGIYYFTYSAGSCHDETYRVQYAISKKGPLGPYEYKGCILRTNEDGTVHGPGHHSILQDGDDYYIFYHRHNNPHSIHGFNRNLCLDKLEFDKDGSILPVTPTHEGVIPASFAKKQSKQLPNLAYQAKVTASSFYDDYFKPEYAADDNNGTLWRSRNNLGSAWIQFDLGKIQKFNQVWIQFEYPTFFYQYKIETSTDGTTWELYADKTDNVNAGSPMIDKKQVKAQFVRITVTDTQKNGHFAGIWNVKIYNASKKNDPEKLLPSIEGIDMAAVEQGYPNLHKKDIDNNPFANSVPSQPIIDLQASKGSTLGTLSSEVVGGKYAYPFDGQNAQTLTSDQLKYIRYNAPYSITAWTLNPEVGNIEVVAQFMPTGADLATIEFCQGTDRQNGLVRHNASFENFGASRECREGAGKWQFWTITYDGWMERIYLNGELVQEKNSFLVLAPTGQYTVGGTVYGENPFTGYLHSLQLYPCALTSGQVKDIYRQPSSTTDKASYNLDGVHLHTEVLAPTLVLCQLVGKDGTPFRQGKQEYTQDEPVIKGTTSSITCHAIIRDFDGNVIKTFTETATSNTKDFVTYDLSDISDGKDKVRLESSGKNMDTDPANNGPMMWKEMEGDFVVQCRISDIMGKARRNTPAYNEGGIMILSDSGRGQQIVHIGVFPNYNCGNMLTIVGRGRPQHQNGKAWDYDPYMQLQKSGDKIYARTSVDGKNWTEMPASPVSARQFAGKKMKVGIYQTTYTDNTAWVEFDDFHIWQKVK